jgi:hypothetical protein
VCPWEDFSKQGEYELGSIGMWSQLISIGPKCHQHGTRIQPKYHANHTLGYPWAGSEHQVAKKRRVGSKWGHMGPKRGSKIIVFGIRFRDFLGIFPHSILQVIYDSLFKDCHGFRIAFGDHFAYIRLTFLGPLEPCFLTIV